MIKSLLVIVLVSLFACISFSAEGMVATQTIAAQEMPAKADVEKIDVAATIPEAAMPLVAKQAKSEDQIPLNIDQVKSASANPPTTARVLFTGVIIAALLTAAYYFVRKYKVSNTINKSNMQIKVLSQHYLGPKKSLAIVRVAGESILIGVTDSNISMIKSLALIDDEVPTEMPQSFVETMAAKNDAVKPTTTDTAQFTLNPEELEEEFSFAGLKETVSKKIKSMRSI